MHFHHHQADFKADVKAAKTEPGTCRVAKNSARSRIGKTHILKANHRSSPDRAHSVSGALLSGSRDLVGAFGARPFGRNRALTAWRLPAPLSRRWPSEGAMTDRPSRTSSPRAAICRLIVPESRCLVIRSAGLALPGILDKPKSLLFTRSCIQRY